MVPEIPLKIGNCKNHLAAFFTCGGFSLEHVILVQLKDQKFSPFLLGYAPSKY